MPNTSVLPSGESATAVRFGLKSPARCSSGFAPGGSVGPLRAASRSEDRQRAVALAALTAASIQPSNAPAHMRRSRVRERFGTAPSRCGPLSSISSRASAMSRAFRLRSFGRASNRRSTEACPRQRDRRLGVRMNASAVRHVPPPDWRDRSASQTRRRRTTRYRYDGRLRGPSPARDSCKRPCPGARRRPGRPGS